MAVWSQRLLSTIIKSTINPSSTTSDARGSRIPPTIWVCAQLTSGAIKNRTWWWWWPKVASIPMTSSAFGSLPATNPPPRMADKLSIKPIDWTTIWYLSTNTFSTCQETTIIARKVSPNERSIVPSSTTTHSPPLAGSRRLDRSSRQNIATDKCPLRLF